MTERTTLQRLREANPFPDPADLRGMSPDPSVLLTAIDERSRLMPTQQAPTRIPPTQTPPRRRSLAVAAVATVVTVVAVLVLFTSQETQQPADTSQPTETTRPESSQPGPIPQVERWVAAVNDGDLVAALAVLSPDASCDLPVGAFETCEDHLGYLVAIETHIEVRDCRETPPYRCSFGFTSGLHATLGYPSYALPVTTEFALDDQGLLMGDFFSAIDPQTPYFPRESGDLWDWMRPNYPELKIGPTFGPELYDAEAGVAAMEAAREFNGPERIIDQLQGALTTNSLAGVGQCATGGLSTDCSDLSAFLRSINAQLVLGCDPSTAGAGTIVCPVTFDSDLHRALGSEASSMEMTIVFRGGKAQALEVALTFAKEPSVNDQFMEFARTVDGLVGESSGRPVWTGETGPGWVAAAEAFVSG